MTHSLHPRQLRAALNLSDTGIMLFEPLRTGVDSSQDFRLILANQRAEAIVGGREQDMLGRPVQSLLPPSVMPDFPERARRVVETGERYETDAYFTLAHQWFRLTLQRHGDGVAATFTTTLAPQQPTWPAEDVLDSLINGVLLYEAIRTPSGQLADFRVRLANKAATYVTGRLPGQLTGQSLTERFPNAHTSGLFARCARTLETGETQQFERNAVDDGLAGWFDVSISKFGDGLLMTFVDITAVKQHTLELQKSIDDLQRSNQNLERFAYVASHDLQEPLRKIQSFGEILRSQSASVLDKESRGFIERMQSAASRMNRLIVDLLAFSHLSAQVTPAERVDLTIILSDVLTDLETAIQDKKARIELTTMPVVTGDPLQLRQVFQNLLSNALKFTRPVPIGASDADATPHILVDCQRLSGHDIVPLPEQTIAPSDLNRPFFAISITDNGIGFDEKYLTRIFDVFQRLHGRNEYQGSGVGLAIVQKVMENHKGYVSAHSQPGGGATFVIYLPDDTVLPVPAGVREQVA